MKLEKGTHGVEVPPRVSLWRSAAASPMGGMGVVQRDLPSGTFRDLALHQECAEEPSTERGRSTVGQATLHKVPVEGVP